MMNQSSKRKSTHAGNHTLLLLLIFLLYVMTGTWAKEGISGKIYYNWSYDNTGAADGYNEFSIKRLYLTYEMKIIDDIKIKVTTDIIEPKKDNAWFSYQKYAYLNWKTTMGDLVFGLQGMNVFNIAEKTWGYRFIEKSPMDEHKFASSADMGLGFKKTLADKVHLHLTVTNGGGYKKAEQDKYKKFAAQAVYGVMDLWKSSGYNAGAVWTTEAYNYGFTDSTKGSVKNKSVIALFGGFAQGALRLGGEFDRFIDNGKTVTKQIVAVYGNYQVAKHVSFYGRYEIYDPDTEINKDGETLIITGLNVSPTKGFNIAPNLRYCVPESGDAEITEIKMNFEFKF